METFDAVKKVRPCFGPRCVVATDETTLWFEHNLYDQLQLLQILRLIPDEKKLVFLVQSDDHLTSLSKDQLVECFKSGTPITPFHLSLARSAWQAFAASTPVAWAQLLRTDCSLLPFLGSAVGQMLDSYPEMAGGLIKIERFILTLLSQMPGTPVHLFQHYIRAFNPVYLGDTSF